MYYYCLYGSSMTINNCTFLSHFIFDTLELWNVTRVTQHEFLSTTLNSEKPTFRENFTVNIFLNFQKLFWTLNLWNRHFLKKFCKNVLEKFHIMRFSRLLLTKYYISIKTEIFVRSLPLHQILKNFIVNFQRYICACVSLVRKREHMQHIPLEKWMFEKMS